jgi:hypothetical protein
MARPDNKCVSTASNVPRSNIPGSVVNKKIFLLALHTRNFCIASAIPLRAHATITIVREIVGQRQRFGTSGQGVQVA